MLPVDFIGRRLIVTWATFSDSGSNLECTASRYIRERSPKQSTRMDFMPNEAEQGAQSRNFC